MTIRCVYEKDPGFPATDQHPNAVRAAIGGKIVDYIGALPTQQEVDAFLSPPPSQDQLDAAAANAYAKLAALKGMTPAQVQNYVATRYSLPAASLAAANAQLALLLDDVQTLAIGVSILARRI